MKLNTRYLSSEENIFNRVTTIAHNYSSNTNAKPIIKLAVGDVVLPISNHVSQAMVDACESLTHSETFRGYGDECGLLSYRQAVVSYYNSQFGVTLSCNEVFASDGAISQLVDILDLFDGDITVAMPDPSYPVYYQNSYLNGYNIITMPTTAENNYVPKLPSCHADVIYLCSPSNPTGIMYDRHTLTQFIDYCNSHGSILVFDSAYQCFGTGGLASIFMLPNAKACCVEIGSLSKSAGFTGIRCGYTIISKQCPLNKMWATRCRAKSNGVSYISQVGGAAALSPIGQLYTNQCVKYYMDNVKMLKNALLKKGLQVTGGSCSPYLWVSNGNSGWKLFQKLLDKYGLLTLPGEGLGSYGEKYVRVSGFCTRTQCKVAVDRLVGNTTI